MKPEEDAFGHELWACYKGEEVFEVVERDDGYVDAISSEVDFSEYEDWHPIEKKAMEFAIGRVESERIRRFWQLLIRSHN